MKKIFILLLLSLVPLFAGAQMVKSSTMTVNKVKIVKEKKVKEKKVREKKTLGPVQPGFRQSVELSYNVPFYAYYLNHYLSAKYIAGYRFNNWIFLGGGTGIVGNISEYDQDSHTHRFTNTII